MESDVQPHVQEPKTEPAPRRRLAWIAVAAAALIAAFCWLVWGI